MAGSVYGAGLRYVRSTVAGESFEPLLEAAYDLPRPVRCVLHARGDNDNYYVWADVDRGQRYVLRLYRADKHWWSLPEENVRFELEWTRYAHERGAPVAYPLRRRDGELLGWIDAPEGRRYWALFSFAEGSDGPLDEGGCVAYGAALACLHQVSDGFASRHARPAVDADFVVDGPARRVEAFLEGARPDDVAFLYRLADRLRPWFERIPKTAATYGVIAGDTHGGNKLVGPDGRLVLIDLDICGWGWRAYDAAIFLWGAKLGNADGERWAPFVRGYESVRPFMEEEREAIPWLVMARQVWLMGAHTVYAEYSGRNWIGQGYWDRQFEFLRQELARLEAAPAV
ncbi:MAG TPA: phosphotransferase [Chloroflexota bacterium]|nr:phosphotransferase [Chloroflexota bacterium]